MRREFYGRYSDIGDPRLGLSAASSRLLTGNHSAYAVLEETLSALYAGRSVLVFNSGYHANIGILPALAGRDDLILSDKLNHASLIDGMRLSEATFRRYPHLDYAVLAEELRGRCQQYRRVFIVSESVFSMDGDAADLHELVRLKEAYDAILLLDEAHAVGVYGANGAGLAAAHGLADRVDILVGTLGKAFGATGAYAVMDTAVRDYLINRMRPLIFTTALPPVVIAWGAFAVGKAAAMQAERQHLLAAAARLRGNSRQPRLQQHFNEPNCPVARWRKCRCSRIGRKISRAGDIGFSDSSSDGSGWHCAPAFFAFRRLDVGRY